MKMGQSVPKRRHINFRRRGITQKKAYNIQYTAKVWNQDYMKHAYNGARKEEWERIKHSGCKISEDYNNYHTQRIIKLLKTKRIVQHRTPPTSAIQNQLVDVASP